ncbi:MAG: hypothetical protein HFH88_10270 [Lachnospiraceae bacterium]|nr:hypothetical protein [Lachnospiraceae bacterium]
MKDMAFKITKAVEHFESSYKETLNKAEVDEKTYNALYSLGADIKHLFDDIIDILDES